MIPHQIQGNTNVAAPFSRRSGAGIQDYGMGIDGCIHSPMVTYARSNILRPGAKIAALDAVCDQIAVEKAVVAAPSKPGMSQKIQSERLIASTSQAIGRLG